MKRPEQQARAFWTPFPKGPETASTASAEALQEPEMPLGTDQLSLCLGYHFVLRVTEKW